MTEKVDCQHSQNHKDGQLKGVSVLRHHMVNVKDHDLGKKRYYVKAMLHKITHC